MLSRDPHMLLPCQQGRRIMGVVYSHSVHLGGLNKVVKKEVVSRPPFWYSSAEWRVWALVCH